MTVSSPDASAAGRKKRRIRGMLVILLVFAITLAAVVADVALHRVVDESRRAEVALLQLRGFAYRLSAFEWQAIGAREMSSTVVAGVRDARADMDRTMGSLEQLSVDAGSLRLVRTTYDAFNLAMNEEFGLLEAGNVAQALHLDEAVVDPAFVAFIEALNLAGAAYNGQAARMEELDFLGSTLILLLAIVAIGALVWQVQRAQAATEAVAVEQQALNRGQAELRLFADNVPSMTVSFDRNLRCVFANKRYADFVGIDKSDIIGRHLREILGDKVYGEVEGHFAQVLQGRPVTYQRGFVLQDGKSRYLEVRLHPDIGEQGKVVGCFAVAHDITELKETEGRLVHLNRVHAVLSGINALIVRVRDRDELFREACRIAVEAGGFRMAWIAIVDPGSKRIVPVGSAGVDAAYLAALDECFSSSEGRLEANTVSARVVRDRKAIVITDLQGDLSVVFGREYAATGIGSMAILPLTVADETVGVIALFATEREFFQEGELKGLTELAGDISFGIDHLDKRERLDYLAYYDELTGLANRTLFLDRVAQHLRNAADSGHKLALFLLDLERFKNINDSLGRPAGDEILKQVAKWLTHNRGDASLHGRLGADLFGSVLPQATQEGNLEHLVEKTLESFVGHPFRHGDAVFRLAAKVGVAVFPDDGADADTLFKNAEAALKMAKASGARYLFHTRKMTESAAGKLTLENQLRQALDNEEFVLHYQPKVNLVSGKLTGAEALIRWNDPRTGLVPPGRFIPLLEETGLIYDVGRWALRKAIADYLRWRAAGLPAVRIAVNVSPLQLRDRGFIAEVGQAIAIDAHAAAGLELELTESLIMEDVKHSIASLQSIRAMGVCVAIDDFGTGFSSLSYLARLPVDTLKIDRSFITDMTAAPEGLSLVSTIINLAHSLKLNVVAEGVETEEQSSLLRLLSCDEMQGFLFSKPVPTEVFEATFMALSKDS